MEETAVFPGASYHPRVFLVPRQTFCLSCNVETLFTLETLLQDAIKTRTAFITG